ncbi:hypothetical protein EVAR_55259_1 [Eumeta japonica]|uniref:Uncharacterized protein n=1 Tax=Eumeta variegata TaxID=151549 RepID=A0A4C1Z1B0_EUMVA|nr:hypothetical protein EVAR_55259_1 [Eumeta japonica]
MGTLNGSGVRIESRMGKRIENRSRIRIEIGTRTEIESRTELENECGDEIRMKNSGARQRRPPTAVGGPIELTCGVLCQFKAPARNYAETRLTVYGFPNIVRIDCVVADTL